MRRLVIKILLWLSVCLTPWPSIVALSQEPAVDRAIRSLDPEHKKRIERVFSVRPGDLFVQLRNGMTVLIQEMHSSKVVSVQVLVKTGSIHEDKYLNGGLSHYLEHVVSGGTTSRFREEEANAIIQSMGGATNAYTSYDRTAYFIDTTSSHYKKALSLLISYVTECTIDVRQFQRERQVIQQEMKLGENDSDRRLWRLFMETAYQVHPIRHPIIGYEDVFVQITRDQLYEYYKTRYVPQNMVVTIVGDVDTQEALAEVIRLAGSVSRDFGRPIYLPEESLPVGPREVEREFPASRLTSMNIGFPSVTLRNPDLYALDVLAIILGNGRTSRFYKRLRDRDKSVLSVSSFNWTPFFARGMFIIRVSLEKVNQERAMESLWEEIENLKRRLVKSKELEKAKRQVTADHIFANQSASGIASSLATSYTATGDPYFDERYVHEIQGVTRKDVRRVARQYLVSDRVTVAVLTPPDKPVESVSTDTGTLPQTKTARIEKRILPNGMVLLTKEDRTVPIVSFQLFGKGGLRFETAGQAGISQFTFGLLTKGTRRRSKTAIAQAMEEIGGRIESGSGRNTFFVSVSVLKEDFDKGLEALADVLTHPSFPPEEIEKQRRDTLLAIRRIDESWEREVERLFLKHYYGGHPYGNDPVGTETSVHALTRDDIMAFYRRLVVANNTVLAIFGDIDTDGIEKRVATAFHDLRTGEIEEPQRVAERPKLVHDDEIEKPTDKVSAALFVGYDGLTIFDRDRPVMDVIDAIVSGIGYPSGWLHESLRGGTRSLVYYVHAYPSYGVDASHFGVITQTTLGNYDEVLNIILQKMERLRTDLVSEGELEIGKNVVVTMHQLGRETTAAQAYEAALWEVLGLGFDWGERYTRMINEVKRGDILRVAQQCFRHRLVASIIPREPVEAVIPPERRERMHVQ